MLTTSNNFKDRMAKAGIEPVYIVELHLDSSTVKYFSTTFVQLSDLAGTPLYPSVSNVVGVSSSIDVESRAASIGEFHIQFLDDGVFREIVKDNFVYGKKVVVKLGCTDFTTYSDFIPVAVGVSRDVLPSEGEITLETTDMLDILRNKTIGPRYWLNGHPLEVIEDILEAAGMDSALYDSSTLSPTADLTRSHFLVSRYDARMYGVDDPIISNGVNDSGESAQDLIDGLCELMWGTFAPNEEGVFKFKIYDPDDSVVRDLGVDDIGPAEQLSAADPLYNKIGMNVGKVARKAGATSSHKEAIPFLGILGQEGTKEVTIGFSQQDNTSMANYNFLGNESGEHDIEFSTDWLCGPSRIGQGFKVVSGTLTREAKIPEPDRPGVGPMEAVVSVLYDQDAINLMDASYNGFCGCKFDLGTIAAASRTGEQVRFPHTFPVQTNRNVSASRPAYILIEGLADKLDKIATVKTIPTIGDTVIELENVNIGNFVVGMVVVFGSDNGPLSAGYSVTSFDSVNDTITLGTGILTEVPVGIPVYQTCTLGSYPSTHKEQWQTEIVKVVDVAAYASDRHSGPDVYEHRELFRFPGADGSLGVWDRSTQRLPKSKDLAITAIGNNPTAAVEGIGYTWPYTTLYNCRYPKFARFRFEGTSGAIGSTNPFGHLGLGSAASGRGQFGTDIPYQWRFAPSTGIAGDNTEDIAEGADGLYYAKAWDITLLVDNVNRRLQRFKNGCPRMKIQTTLRHADLQLGDFITIVTDIYSAYGRNGATSDVVFEVISKTVDALADSPGCEFELALVKDKTVSMPASVYAYHPYVAQRGWQVSLDTSVYNESSGGAIEPVLTSMGIEVTTETGRS